MAVLGLLCACANKDAEPSAPTALEPPTEAGVPTDAEEDAGLPVIMDAGQPPDAGVEEDAGLSADAGIVDERDAGTTIDAGTTLDAGVDAGTWCPPGALLCESFENGLDSARWRTNGDATAFSIDETQAQHGRRSLHLTYGLPSRHTGNPTVQLLDTIPAPDDRVFVRAWLRMGNLGLPGQHPGFIDVSDVEGREQAFGSIINDFAMLAWTPGGLDNARIWYEGTSGWHPPVENGDATPTTENGLTSQEWFCVELMFFGDHQGANDSSHPNEETRVWINDAEIPQLAESDALWRLELGREPPEHWSPNYAAAKWRFGLTSFGPTSAPIDLWFDSLVFSNTRIGCE